METVEISLTRPCHAYEIVIGPGPRFKWRENVEFAFPAERYILLADANLSDASLLDSYHLPSDGMVLGKWACFHVKPGEENKNLRQYASLIERIIAAGLDRNTVLVALGGGVTGDMAGFIAATLLRGIRLVQIPTTFLAMVDSSVGGKNGVNAAAGKNMVGTFHQPDGVLIDPAFLDTLPWREYRAGVAELVKTAIIAGHELFDFVRDNAPGLAAGEHAVVARAVAACCRVKAHIVMEDENDTGVRQLLNLGHTFGHVLESLAGYDGRVVHGEAVAVGTVLATCFSVERGLMDEETATEIDVLFRRLGLPTTIQDLGKTAEGAALDWVALLAGDQASRVLGADKKSAAGKVTLILPHAIGDCRLGRGVAVDEVIGFMRRMARRPDEPQQKPAAFV